MLTCRTHFFRQQSALLLIGVSTFACARQTNSLPNLPTENPIQISASAVNINTATVAELEKLPHVGEQKARAIVEHRERFGAFRKPEHMLFVRGISDRQFREIRSLVKVE